MRVLTKSLTHEILACAAGILIGGLFTQTFLISDAFSFTSVTPAVDYHIHADFLVQTGETVHEFGTAEFMTTAEQKLHSDAHLHDEDGDVLHMHLENVPFMEFLNSLGITLTDGCLSISDTEEAYCETDSDEVALYVNEERWAGDISTYIPQDLDRVLLYVGPVETAPLSDYLEAIPDDACFYSGSCPERGIAPPESCGLTCDL